MLNLVMKDFLIQKKIFIYAALYSIFAVTAFPSTMTPRGAYMFGIISIAYLLIIYSNGYDEKNKSEVVLNSLPVRRENIVISKYIALAVFAFIGVIVTGIAGAIVTKINIINGMRFINIYDIVGAFISIGLMYSIYYPLYFKFGTLKLKIFNIVLYMIFLFVPNLIVSIIQENPNDELVIKFLSILNNSPSWMIQTFSALLILICIIISMEISIGVYRKKEF